MCDINTFARPPFPPLLAIPLLLLDFLALRRQENRCEAKDVNREKKSKLKSALPYYRSSTIAIVSFVPAQSMCHGIV